MSAKAIAKNINLLNVILIAGLLFFLQFSLMPRLTAKVTYTPPNIKKSSEEKKEEVAQPAPSPLEYTIIAEQNVFHPERRIPPEKKDVAQAPLPVPEFVLYGTLITSDTTIAYIDDLKAPQSTPGRGKRQTALRKGDAMSGFALKEVEPDRIVMVRGEEKITVYLNDSHKPKMREATAGGPQQPVAGARQSAVPPARAQAAAPPQAVVSPPQQSAVSEPVPTMRPEDVRQNFMNIFTQGKKR